MSHSEIMDKPSGLKECPRCGLRNRSGAYQCDFCGWDFRGASDDWMGKVNELQRINKEVESPVLDKRTTSKIEMTIVNPAEVPVKEPKPEMEVPRKLELDEHNDVEPIVAAAVKDEVPFDPEEISQAQTGTEEEAPIYHKDVDVQTKVEASAGGEVESGDASKDLTRYMPQGLLITGAAIYGVTLALSAGPGMSAPLGWLMGIFGALFIVTGLGMLYIDRTTPDTSDWSEAAEVVLCPECHEVVAGPERSCPNCGAHFEDVTSRE